jgi:hypothetical protein
MIMKNIIYMSAILLTLGIVSHCYADSASVKIICTGGGSVDAVIRNVSDNKPAEGGRITWSDVNVGQTGWRTADQYIEISYDSLPESWGIQLYTDNRNEQADPRYTGTAVSAGLVDINNNVYSLPIAWRITDSVIINPASPVLREGGEGFNDYSWHFITDRRGQSFEHDTRIKIKSEADYILSCQYLNEGHPAHGAINNVYGAPTWIVPRENAMAILGLIIASDVSGDNEYRQKANSAADYLLSVQESDGAWCNQYNYAAVHDAAKSPTQTAEVMMALGQLGYRADRYNAMKKAAEFLMACQDVNNIGGTDHGLLGGGKDASGAYSSWRWTSDNAYAYQAIRTARLWAEINEDNAFAESCAAAAEAIIQGIDNHLYNQTTGVWHVAIDANGVSLDNPDLPDGHKHHPNWISYSPQMLNLPVYGVNLPDVGEWIKDSFQQADGACIAYSWEAEESEPFKTRKYPGYSFQSALCWMKLGQDSYAESAISWAENSGLWQNTEDVNNVTGGWIDWREISPVSGRQAPEWERFIDTSFYAIACWVGGYDFNIYADNSANYGKQPFINGADSVTAWNQSGIAWHETGRSGNPDKAYIYLASDFSSSSTGAEYKTSTLTVEAYKGISVFPFYLYKDAPFTEYPDEPGATLENHFAPSGWMNYAGQFSIDSKSKDITPYSGEHCLKISWNGAAGSDGWKWGGIVWQEPEGEWFGGAGKGYDLRGADSLSFWARTDSFSGQSLKIEVYLGYPGDSCGVVGRQWVGPLTTSWQKYTIPVQGKDISRVSNGFTVIFNDVNTPRSDNKCNIYIDDIKYDKS